MENLFLSIRGLNVTIGAQRVLTNINLDIHDGEQWMVAGPAGSGKSVFAYTLAGRHFFTGTIHTSFGDPENFYQLVKIVEQQHRFRDITNRIDFYYQQRYNSFDAERTITVQEDLSSYFGDGENGFSRSELLDLLEVNQLLDEPLIQLSNGENKRLQLVKALLQKQKLLILDQPFVGLDAVGRERLKKILKQLSQRGVQMILISSTNQIPDYITHIAIMENGILKNALAKSDFRIPEFLNESLPLISRTELEAIGNTTTADFDIAVKMTDVNIIYGDKKILRHINWEVRRGEKWGLSGPNGAGKSTLLSLITADNPQAYANEIYLFDRRRGTGESIWDIKRKIGYISPELHLYFDFSATAFQSIASGLFDTIGLFRQLNAEQEALVFRWINIIGLQDKQNKLLKLFSLGEQRLILLARALIKNPPLLILDEPCQGLDEKHVQIFRTMVNEFCQIYNTTLIYVTHYREEIPDVVDQFIHIEHGMITGAHTN